MSTGRVMWIIWCLGWAGVWAIAAFAAFPHRGCVLPNVVITDGNACSQWGGLGSGAACAVFGVLAAVSVAAICAPVGRPGAGGTRYRNDVPPPGRPSDFDV